ncbi:MAG: hypothetical protein AAFU57_02585 [Bacteroidota bacterium]
MNKQRIAILLIASLGLLATFMPWATVPILGGMSGTENTLGWVSLSFFAIPMVVSLIGNKHKDLVRIALIVTVTASVLAFVTCICQLYVFNSMDSSDNLFEAMLAEQIKVGFGLYIALFAGLLLPLFAFLMRDSELSAKQAEALRNYKKKTAKKVRQPKVKVVEEVVEKVEAPETQEPKNKIDKEDHSRFMPS